MIRFFLRLIGFVLLAAAFAALIVDGTRTVAARDLMMFSLGETAAWLLPSWLAQVSRAAEQTSALVSLVFAQALRLPTCVVAVVLAIGFFLAGRRPPRRIGYMDER